MHSRTPWVSPANSPVRLGVSPAATSTPTGVFSQRFEPLFPRAGTLDCVVCLAPHLFLSVYLHSNVGLPGPQAAAMSGVLSAQLRVSTTPTNLDDCFFFNSLVIGLPYSLSVCQFWLFFVFKFVVVLLVVRGGTVCLPLPPSWPEVHMLILEPIAGESLGKGPPPCSTGSHRGSYLYPFLFSIYGLFSFQAPIHSLALHTVSSHLEEKMNLHPCQPS